MWELKFRGLQVFFPTSSSSEWSNEDLSRVLLQMNPFLIILTMGNVFHFSYLGVNHSLSKKIHPAFTNTGLDYSGCVRVLGTLRKASILMMIHCGYTAGLGW